MVVVFVVYISGTMSLSRYGLGAYFGGDGNGDGGDVEW
jgi:hypothetical protein